MSCRVLQGALAADARPLFGSIGGILGGPVIIDVAPEAHTEPEPEFDPVPILPAGPTPEVLELHSRIVDLEKAMEREVQQAREAAFQAGEAAGRQIAAGEVQPVLERLARNLADLTTLRNRIRRDTESELVQLSIAIAKRILRRELTVDADSMLGLVKAALEKVQARDVCRIRVHPDHHATVNRYMDRIASVSGVEVLSDRSLLPGDVIVETKRGDLDASIETQLAEIERGFTDRLGR